jgi:hypothetical protein
MNMRGVQVQVPDEAQQRLAELNMARDSALDLVQATQNRINMLPDGEADDLRKRLVSEREKHAQRHNHLQRLVSACNQYLMQLRLVPGTELQCHPPLNLTIKTSLPAAVESTRRMIRECQQDIAKVRAAPLKVSSKREAARAYLERLGQIYAPKLVFDGRGNAKAMWREDMVVSKDEILSLIVWALGPNGPAELVEAFAIDEGPEPEGALTPFEKEETLGRFSKTLLTLSVQVALAGRAATEVLLGSADDYGCSSDDGHAMRLLLADGLRSPWRARYMRKYLLDDTRLLIRAHRRAVEAVANALLEHETLSGAEIDQLMERSRGLTAHRAFT